MGTYDTPFIGLKTPPTGVGSEDWGDGEAYDVNANTTLLDALLTNEGRTYIVGKPLDTTTYPYLDDGDSQRVFDSIQDAIDSAQAAYAGSTGGATILVHPGTYDEHLAFDMRCSIHIIGMGGTPHHRNMARDYAQVLIRGPVDGAVDAPTIQCNPNSSYSAAVDFDNIAFDNQSFQGTGQGTKQVRLFDHYPGSSWSASNGYFRFRNCQFMVAEVNTSITWNYGFRYDKTNVQNNWGGLFFDGCRFRFNSVDNLIVAGFYLKTHPMETSRYNVIGYRRCEFLIGVQDEDTWKVAGDYINAYVEHCALSEGVTSGTVVTIDGVNGDVLGVQGGSDPTYGNNVQSQMLTFWC